MVHWCTNYHGVCMHVMYSTFQAGCLSEMVGSEEIARVNMVGLLLVVV